MSDAADPNVSNYYNNRGMTFLKLNKRDLALDDFDRAVRLDPNNKEAVANRATPGVGGRPAMKAGIRLPNHRNESCASSI